MIEFISNRLDEPIDGRHISYSNSHRYKWIVGDDKVYVCAIFKYIIMQKVRATKNNRENIRDAALFRGPGYF
jgi:hypothetical protein